MWRQCDLALIIFLFSTFMSKISRLIRCIYMWAWVFVQHVALPHVCWKEWFQVGGRRKKITFLASNTNTTMKNSQLQKVILGMLREPGGDWRQVIETPWRSKFVSFASPNLATTEGSPRTFIAAFQSWAREQNRFVWARCMRFSPGQIVSHSS